MEHSLHMKAAVNSEDPAGLGTVVMEKAKKSMAKVGKTHNLFL